MNWYKIAIENSSEVEWLYDTDEMFEFVMSRYDVRKAKEIIHNNPRGVANMRLTGMTSIIPKRHVKRDNGQFTMSPGIGVDWGRIDTEIIDITTPVIVATAKNGSLLPIDGWHRIAKAMDQGIEVLPAVLLTREETQQIEL